MTSVMTAVAQVVENSEFARKGLQEGLLNISAYAKTIHHEVEEVTKKEIKNRSSIVMALSRYGRRLQQSPPLVGDLQILNITSRSKLVEVAYSKTTEVQERMATLNLLDSIKNASFFVSTIGLAEITIIIDSSLVDIVKGHFGSIVPIAQIDGLASLTIQVGIETINLPGQSYRVLERLASRKIAVVEHMTSPTEHSIILYEKDISQAFQLLNSVFLKKS